MEKEIINLKRKTMMTVDEREGERAREREGVREREKRERKRRTEKEIKNFK